jgi:hypothetical protein
LRSLIRFSRHSVAQCDLACDQIRCDRWSFSPCYGANCWFGATAKALKERKLLCTKGTAYLSRRAVEAVPHRPAAFEGFTGCGKTHVLYQGTTLVGP